ncbi:MAG: MFS family permease [Gammaproteobacteria bacterium]|jgi:MFS family permease
MQYFISVFISAFLIFQIQPIISKIILPWFGGGASVWTTCMLFFQFFLLIGYLYAYLLTKILKVKHQIVVHLVFLLCSLFLLPYNISDIQNTLSSGPPTWAVLKVLFLGLGFPYLILSANTPLLQHWFTRETNGANPYRLYAISNIGSFLALVSYPVLIEPFMTLDWQVKLWSSIYYLFVLLVAWIFFIVAKQNNKDSHFIPEHIINPKVGSFRLTLWFMLSALGVVLLVSTTNALTQNVPPVPFLWLAPLAIYLLTYVVTFSNLGIYVRYLWLPFFMLLSFVALLIYFIGGQFDIITQLLIYLLILLCGCMICHGELNSLKPKQGNTTLFYLVLSGGGVFGSFLVSFVAKSVFDEFLEFPLAIFSVLVLATASLLWNKQDILADAKPILSGVNHRHLSILAAGSAVVALVWLLAFSKLNNQYQQYDIAKARNFYGILTVKDITEGNVNERRLIDGTTSHGSQSLPLSKSAVPLSYYRPGTGVQLVIEELSSDSKLQVGIIGLGVGALAAYGQSGDHYTFYEINPLVSDFAHKYFSYLDRSQAEVEVKLGDARVSLQHELDLGQNNGFDLLIIDAFSGDLIPTHLMTHEAFLLYQQHIKTQGVMALHLSNRHLSLLPVIVQHSNTLDMQVMLFETPGNGNEHDAQWVVLTNNSRITQSPNLIYKQSVISKEQYKKVLWTDDYSSLLPILKVLN